MNMINPTPTDFAAALGISVSHASNILSGKRPAGQDIALAAFRAFGVRLGLLAEMTDADISRLCAQGSEAAECFGGDAAASGGSDASVTSFGHDDSDSARATDLSTGQAGEMSRQADMERAA